MNKLWNKLEAESAANSDLGLRVYSSNLLGSDPDLVLHGGGNTSVKGERENVFGETQEVLFVKGSGWDLRTIEAAGFPPVDLAYLRKLGQLSALGDSDMMQQLRLALLDPAGPTPSVEAILHALIPHKYVDHTHADAVVTISNSPDGERILQELFGDEVLILPYIMPGFILAKQVAEATIDLDWSKIRGIILLHHGVFTFSEDAQTSYENMIEMVDKAEAYLQSNALFAESAPAYAPNSIDAMALAQLRKQAGELFGGSVLLRLQTSAAATSFASLQHSKELIARGPLTPDHTIHCKAFGAHFEADMLAELDGFAADYKNYFDQFSSPEHQCLDCMPRYGVWQDKGMLYFAANQKRLQIVSDITEHTIRAIQQAEQLGAWEALPRADLFAVEYWELEQAKLKSSQSRDEFEGKVAVVTGAASGIGRATVEALIQRGAVVIALDMAQSITQDFSSLSVLPVVCDVTDQAAIEDAITQGVCHFGGVDLVVSNAGSFPASASIAELDDASWQQTLDVNLSSHMKVLRTCTPYLQSGFQPAVVIVGSKNVPAPGPGAAAYSAAKAGLTQLARVAALELGAAGIRVNTIHPNAIYDTGIWTDDVLAQRAAHYGKTVDEYKKSNVLATDLKSSDVARSIVSLLGREFSKTTGEQIAIDGGNDRVI